MRLSDDAISILTLVGTIVTILGPLVMLTFWNRREFSNEVKELRKETKTDIKELEQKIESKIDSLIFAIQAEIKDFHGRLCTIEERNKTKP